MSDSPDKYQKFDQVLAELKAEIDRLAREGSKIGALDRVYGALNQKSDDIRGMEQHLGGASGGG